MIFARMVTREFGGGDIRDRLAVDSDDLWMLNTFSGKTADTDLPSRPIVFCSGRGIHHN